MFISHKSNVIQVIRELEWDCRRVTKGMSKPEYWAWEETIKNSDGVPDYSDETGYTIVECTDEDVSARLEQLQSYVTMDGIYNIKYYSTKRDSEIVDYKSHFIADDTAKDARILADKWKNVRLERNRKLAETDYLALSDNTLSNDMKNYRDALRDVPSDNSDPDNIDWPVKP